MTGTAPSPARGRPYFDPFAWPKCDATVVNLWDALALAGRALHGEDWTGEELDARDWRPSPVEQNRLNNERVAKLAALPSPPGRVRSAVSAPITGEKNTLSAKELNDLKEKWAAAAQARLDGEQSLWEANEVAIARLRRTMTWLHDRFRFGEIQTATMFPAGASNLLEAPATDWHISEPVAEQRFRTGRYKRVWSQPYSAIHEVLIFVDSAALQARLATLPHAHAIIKTTDLATLSPYLRFCVQWALANQDNLQNPTTTHDTLWRDLVSAWNADNPSDPIAKTVAERMARIIRVHDQEAKIAGAKATSRGK